MTVCSVLHLWTQNGASVLRLRGPSWDVPEAISYESQERPTDRVRLRLDQLR